MKTIDELMKELNSSEALANELKAVKNADELAAFLKAHGCEAAVDDFKAALKTAVQGEKEGALSDDEAAAVAGGGWLKKRFGNIFGNTGA